MEFEKSDLNLNLVKEALNSGKIKLWLPPYHGDSIDGSDALKTLACTLSEQLKLPEYDIFNHLEVLQKKAIENLKEREAYQSTGLASLKIRSTHQSRQPFTVKIQLGLDGKALKELVAVELKAPPERMKLISKGRVITDEGILQEQGVRHGAQMMCLLLSSDPEHLAEEMERVDSNIKAVDSTKRDVELLAGRSNPEGESYIQITDQTGKTIPLPKKEQRSLMMAMTLHEKGRAAMKAERFDLALIILLEAEKLFSECQSELLESVDNYGLLSLDLAWCYLHLKSLSQLPDAQMRLQRCQKLFHNSYGPNLERLLALKGSSGNEACLFVRLHLLQAIVMFHQGQLDGAEKLLDEVSDQLKRLKVDDHKLSNLVELGYPVGESRMALRESKGDMDLAVSLIENKRVERKRIELEAKKERELAKERKKLGKCVDGSWVEPQFHKALLSMGYSSDTARWALSQTGNRISDAVALIQEHPERLPMAQFTDAAVAQVAGLGFDPRHVMDALNKHGGDLNRAIEELMANPSTSSAGGSSSTKREDWEKEKDAYSRVAEGIADTEDDYLDLELNAEETFLNHYRDLLSKR